MRFPDVHPFSIHWRMGAGEGYLSDFWPWWSAHAADLDTARRIAYLQQWPMPPVWTLHALEMIWPDLRDDILLAEAEDDRAARDRVFAKAAEAGLPDEAAWWADMNDPKWREAPTGG